MARGYKDGMEHFQRGEYTQAIDCFEEDLIPNDLQYVVDKINEYNN